MRFLSKLPTLIVLSVISLIGFGAVALAAGAPDPAPADSSILDLLRPVADAFAGGHYAYAGALLVIVLVALVKRYLGTSVPWFHSDAGGTALALVASTATAVSVSLAAPGATLSLAVVKTALLVGVGAAGGFAALKNLVIEPLLIPLEAKAPAWLKPAFSIVLWIFDKPDAIKQAEAAGSAAVAAAPAQGTAAVVGTPTDVK